MISKSNAGISGDYRLPLGEVNPAVRTRKNNTPLDINYFDATKPTTVHSGNLPHLCQQGTAYFVTFRLADSLPQSKIRELKHERDIWQAKHTQPLSKRERKEYYSLFVERMDKWLDAGSGTCILLNPEVRAIVSNAFHYFSGERYLLGPFVIMPNHIHIIFAPIEAHTLSSVVHSWKSFTAKKINQHLKRTGPIWQKESFDHVIRSPESYANKVRYIIENPEHLRDDQYTLGVNRAEAKCLFPDYPHFD